MNCSPPTRRRQPPRYPYEAFEPELRDVLKDPIVQTLMTRDGVGLGDIRYLTTLVHRRVPAPTRRRSAWPTWPGADLLRTPLNAILGFAWMIEHETLGPVGEARYKCYARDISAAGETLLGLLECVMPMDTPEGGRETPSKLPPTPTLGRQSEARKPAADTSLTVSA